MIRALVVFWMVAIMALVEAAVWTSGGSTSSNLGGTAFFVLLFGMVAAFIEAGRMGSL